MTTKLQISFEKIVKESGKDVTKNWIAFSTEDYTSLLSSPKTANYVKSAKTFLDKVSAIERAEPSKKGWINPVVKVVTDKPEETKVFSLETVKNYMLAAIEIAKLLSPEESASELLVTVPD